jgi:hypothetical protein
MNNSTELRFLSDDANENDGLGDAGIETYKDAVYASIARETGQNSADAWEAKPVKMNFDVIEIDRNQLPGLQKLCSTVDICLAQAITEKDEKAIDFFNRAKEVLAADKIKVLHVADYNTKGLIGPSKRGTPFHSLVKGSGISIKESETSGGSFGIGKNAAFAISELQTVFYSSQYKLEGKLHFISQGKTILVSHVDEQGEHKKAKGYWGLPRFEAITELDAVPSWLQRKEQGTSIFSAGFRFQSGWQHKMAASLLSNFFCAIHKGEMEFVINEGEIQLNKHTLAELFEKDEIRKAAEENNSLEGFEFAKSLFNCLTSAYTKEKEFSHDVLGKISFKILVSEGLPKKIALVRNGMVITENLEHFGDKFAKFPMSKEFIAIVEAQENVGSALIKKLENPRHDGLSAERINDPKKRREANTAIKTLIKMIREAIREETTTIPDKEVTVDELTEFFADDSSHEKSDNPEHEDNLETFVYNVNEKQQSQQTVKPSTTQNSTRARRGQQTNSSGTGNGGSNGSGNRNSNSQGSNSGSAQNEGQDDTAGNQNEFFELNISDIRNIFIHEDGKIFRRIFFTSPLTCQAQIAIQATGINDVEYLKLESARVATINDNQAILDVTEGQRASFDVEIAENYQGPIEIIAYTTGGSNETK